MHLHLCQRRCCATHTQTSFFSHVMASFLCASLLFFPFARGVRRADEESWQPVVARTPTGPRAAPYAGEPREVTTSRSLSLPLPSLARASECDRRRLDLSSVPVSALHSPRPLSRRVSFAPRRRAEEKEDPFRCCCTGQVRRRLPCAEILSNTHKFPFKATAPPPVCGMRLALS